MSERIFSLDELEFPEDFYPRARGETWWFHVNRYADEMKAGSRFPPIRVGILNGRNIVVDGWHRCNAFKLLKMEYITAIVEHYDSEKELFADAVRFNTTHGIQLTPQDKARIIGKLQDMMFSPLEIGAIVKATPETLQKLQMRKITTPRGSYYLKSPLVKLRDRGWIDNETASQLDQSQIYIRTIPDTINQLITFIEGDAFPWEDPLLGTALAKLYTALKERYAPLMEAKTS